MYHLGIPALMVRVAEAGEGMCVGGFLDLPKIVVPKQARGQRTSETCWVPFHITSLLRLEWPQLWKAAVGEEEEDRTVSLEPWELAPVRLACSPWPVPRLPWGTLQEIGDFPRPSH